MKRYMKEAQDLEWAKENDKTILIECRGLDDPTFETNGYYVRFINGVPCAFNENNVIIAYNIDISINSEYTKYFVEEQ